MDGMQSHPYCFYYNTGYLEMEEEATKNDIYTHPITWYTIFNKNGYFYAQHLN